MRSRQLGLNEQEDDALSIPRSGVQGHCGAAQAHACVQIAVRHLYGSRNHSVLPSSERI